MYRLVNAFYFSPTGTTGKVAARLAEELSRSMCIEKNVRIIDFTLPDKREVQYDFADDDLVVVGVPVIAGRVPNVLLKFLNAVRGNNASAVAMVVYGNRNYDDALVELKDLLEKAGFIVKAGCAFIGEHSFSNVLAKGRPDGEDMSLAEGFAAQISERIKSGTDSPVEVKGNKNYSSYYKPRDREGNPVDFRKIVPKTGPSCTGCKICIEVCPMGSIDSEDPSKMSGICIKCCACVKNCPSQAKHFDDEHFVMHKKELEEDCRERKEPELFLQH